MKRLRRLIFALGVALPLAAGAAVDRGANADRSVVSGTSSQDYCWVCYGGFCFWEPC